MLTSRPEDAVNSSARLAAILFAALGGCSSATVRLGDQSPEAYRFGPPRQLTELGTTVSSDNPTLTADLLEIYFTSNRDMVSTDVWRARRAAADAPFGTPELVREVSTPAFETSSAISPDGLTLWFGSDRPGGIGDLDVWMSTRANRQASWSAPVNVLALSSPAKDVPRTPGQHGLVMPMASERASTGVYRTYLAARASRTAPFGAPQALPELILDGKTTVVDGFLSDDGLILLYSSAAVGGPGDLFMAWRRSLSETFSLQAPLVDLNSDADDRDPWLTPDGTHIYFSSDRSGVLAIYEAAVLPMQP
jgi:hypothetical protein